MSGEMMSEDQLISGLLEALSLGGWKAWHMRRSDRGLLMGAPGWPDITALPRVVGRPLLVIEAKTGRGVLTAEQARWIVQLHRAGITAVVIRPAGYDRALGLIVAGTSDPDAWEWAFRP
jgi:hypothetical protein